MSLRESDTGACVGGIVGEASIEEEEETSETSETSKGNSSFRASCMKRCSSKNELTEPRMPTKAERRSRRTKEAGAGDESLAELAEWCSRGAA